MYDIHGVCVIQRQQMGGTCSVGWSKSRTFSEDTNPTATNLDLYVAVNGIISDIKPNLSVTKSDPMQSEKKTLPHRKSIK